MIALKLASLLALVAACFLVADAQLPKSEEECPLTQVCFLIDQSGSINPTEYIQEQAFVVKIAETIKDIVTDVELSAVAFATQAQVIQPPTDILADFSAVVSGPRLFTDGLTAMASGLQECFDQLLPLDGNRIIVLVTDGAPNSKPDTTAIANQIRGEEDMFLVTVGIGLSPNGQQFLEGIAHAPEFAIVTDFAGLMAKVEELVELICEVVEEEDDCEHAYEQCMFQFKGETGLTEYDVKPFMQDTPFTPGITPKDPTLRLGTLNTRADCPPEFITDTGAVPITQFGIQPFTPTHFKPYWVSQDFCSGIGHQTFHSNQGSIAKDKCIRVYFTSYQLMRLDSSGNKVLIANFNDVPKSENKCVVFKTKA